MALVRVRESEAQNLQEGRFEPNSSALLALHQTRIARVLSRFLFFGLFLFFSPEIGPLLKQPAKFQLFVAQSIQNSFGKEQFSEIIDELVIAGILKKGQRSLTFIAGPIDEAPVDYAQHLRYMKTDVVIDNNPWQQGAIASESFDIAFTQGAFAAGFIDRVLKIGGTVVLPAKDISSTVFLDWFDYRCVCIKPYDPDFAVFALVKRNPTRR